MATSPPSEAGHAQPLPISTREEEFYPPHPPRAETPQYHATHTLLIDTLDQPCHDCGVRKSTLDDPAQNPLGAHQLETHHYPIQREYADAVDWRKVQRDFTQVIDRASLLKFIDSPANMLVLCDVDHRSPTRGIHHLPASDQAVKKYLLDGYELVGPAAKAADTLKHDKAIVEAAIKPEEEM